MNFKKLTMIFSLGILTAFLLGACAPAATPVAVETSAPVAVSVPVDDATTQPEAAAQTTSAAVELNTTYENAVSVEQQLILGTFKLEGTDLAVSKDQAGILIPLYSNLKTIVESMMPAQGAQGDPASAQPQTIGAKTQAQVDEIIKNILAAMTPEQVKAISEMQITREVAQTIMTEKGISMGGPGQGGKMADGNGQPPQGTPPTGGQSGGGNAPQGDAPNGQRSGGGMIQPELINLLLEALQSK